MLRNQVRADLARVLASAELHAWAGNNPAKLLNDSGRMVYIVLGAAEATGHTTAEPDVRIILGMGEALGDLQHDQDIERHRPAIQSGILAVGRLLPTLDAMALAHAALQLNQMLNTPAGMGTADLRALFSTEVSP